MPNTHTHTNILTRKQSPISNTVIITSIVTAAKHFLFIVLSINRAAFAFILCCHQFFSLCSSFFTYPFMSCAFVFFLVYLCSVSYTMSTDSLSFSSPSLLFILICFSLANVQPFHCFEHFFIMVFGYKQSRLTPNKCKRTHFNETRFMLLSN